MATIAPETGAQRRLAGPVPRRLAAPAPGEPREDREPATGRPSADPPQSTPEDVARAAATAAGRPARLGRHELRRNAPRVLRRAAEIYEAHRPEFGTWTQRETGAVHGKMHHEQNFAAGEINAAATMPFQPYGQLVPSVVPGPAVDAPPRPGRGHRRDHAVELPERARACASSRRRSPWATPSSSSPIPRRRSAAAPCSRRSSGGRPARRACSRSSSAARRSARRSSRTRTSTGVSFTGSTAAGRRVGTLAGQLLKRVSLELGGNNAFIVLDDADLEAAASAGAFASFQFQGQVCFATGRHIVHRSIAEAYVDLLAEKAARLRLGDPYREDVDLGPIVNQKQLERVDGIVRRSVDGRRARSSKAARTRACSTARPC